MYIHAYVYIYIYTCIYIHIYMSVHINACTHTHTHTYKIYVCTHANTSEMTARQRLRGQPDLMQQALPFSLSNPEGDCPPWPAAILPVHEGRRISAEHSQTTALHHTITTARYPDYNHSSALVRSQSTQCMAHPSCETRRL